MTVFAAGDTNVPARIVAAGREVDDLVRLNGQRLIKLSDVGPKDRTKPLPPILKWASVCV